MLLPTAIDIPEREVDIAAKVMDAGKVCRELAFFCRSLCLVEQIKRLVQPFADSKPFRQSNLCLAARDVIWRCLDRLAV